ncbi:MAG TPA: pyridoxal-dependent decarboxylase, exosortase A system-associated, partial [Allosphingosinicella sp.]
MTKAMGPIPPDFTDRDGMLMLGGRSAADLIAEAGGTPLFVYDAAIIGRRIARFRQAFGASVHLHYAMKANPCPQLLNWIAKKVDGIDVASAGEMRAALSAGADPGHISFAGPGKRDAELEAAIAAGATINLESEGEAERAIALGSRIGR